MQPRKYKVGTTLRNEMQSGDYQMPVIKNGPNIYKPVQPPVPKMGITSVDPLPTKKSQGSQCTNTKPKTGSPSRLKVLDNDADEMLILTDDMSNLIKTKNHSTPKNARELREKEKVRKNKERFLHIKYPERSLETNMLELNKSQKTLGKKRVSVVSAKKPNEDPKGKEKLTKNAEHYSSSEISNDRSKLNYRASTPVIQTSQECCVPTNKQINAVGVIESSKQRENESKPGLKSIKEQRKLSVKRNACGDAPAASEKIMQLTAANLKAIDELNRYGRSSTGSYVKKIL